MGKDMSGMILLVRCLNYHMKNSLELANIAENDG